MYNTISLHSFVINESVEVSSEIVLVFKTAFLLASCQAFVLYLPLLFVEARVVRFDVLVRLLRICLFLFLHPALIIMKH